MYLISELPDRPILCGLFYSRNKKKGVPMKKLLLTSVMAMSVIGGAHATTYIGNPDTPTADWGNWVGAINTTSPEAAAAVNNLAVGGK